jgi:sugar (pentulose or hexulose) kinase
MKGTLGMKRILGIEFGSTRIKAVLTDEKAKVLASGSFAWENKLLKGGVWSYDLKDAIAGMQSAYAALKANYAKATGEKLTSLDAAGISGMMHGYLPFDAKGKQLAPFRTWRCTITAPSAARLSKAFSFAIPQRWSVCHLYQRILDGGAEVPKIASITTLAGWIHSRLTGEKVMGLGEASGMFPVDSSTKDYDAKMLKTFDRLVAPKKYPWRIRDILPRALPAGAQAGNLTKEGALLLDPTGELAPGAVFAPPEGDVQTGMIATNAVTPGFANVSAGTSIFAVVIMEKPLSRPYPQINIVASPSGAPAAMSHATTCTSDINAWVKLLGGDYDKLFAESLKGAPDCGGVLTVPYLSGEPLAGMDEGRPLVVRRPDADFSLANFMRANIYSAFTTVRLGLDILFAEGVRLRSVTGHGGIFKTPKVAQQYLADALNAPVTCLSTAGEGGAWGMAILAAYALSQGAPKAKPEKLEDYMSRVAFKGSKGVTLKPTKAGVKGFAAYFESFKKALDAERASLKV